MTKPMYEQQWMASPPTVDKHGRTFTKFFQVLRDLKLASRQTVFESCQRFWDRLDILATKGSGLASSQLHLAHQVRRERHLALQGTSPDSSTIPQLPSSSGVPSRQE